MLYRYVKLLDRKIIFIKGNDALILLDRISTNKYKSDITYSLILNHRGMIIADFFMIDFEDGYLIDCYNDFVDQFIRIINLYKLSLDVVIQKETNFNSYSLYGDIPDNIFAFRDCRSKNLGHRAFINNCSFLNLCFEDSLADYETRRIKSFIPEMHKDILPSKSYPIDYYFDEINAIDFNKGCYVGQEVTCKMKDRRKLKKTLCLLSANEFPIAGSHLLLNGNKIGVMCSSVCGIGLSLINKDIAIVGNVLDDNIIVAHVKECAE